MRKYLVLQLLFFAEEYAQFYGAMNTMRNGGVTMRKDGLPYDEMGYVPPPNRSVDDWRGRILRKIFQETAASSRN